jgi:RNA recognition motif-containing protein
MFVNKCVLPKNILGNLQFKNFATGEVEGERREYTGDPRIPRYNLNRLKVLGLPKTTNQEDLVKKFGEFGELVGFKFIESEPNDFGEERGVFYFSYATVQEGEKAMAAVGAGGEFELNGRNVRLSFQRNKFFPKWTRSVFVANISRDTTEEDLKDYFAEIGEVIGARIPTDPTNGRPRGFGFVEFLEKRSQYEAVKRDGEVFMGRELAIKPSDEPRRRDQDGSF